jgi:hypothetical protein
MPAVIVTNQFGEDIEAPHKEDGARYRYEMLFAGQTRRAYADDATSLVAALLGETYTDLDDQERLSARVRFGTGLLSPLQASALEGFDVSALSADEQALLFQPRHEPVVAEEWASEVPLVLLDVHYAPFSDIPAPLSSVEQGLSPRNLLWVRVADEMDLILSLDRIGYITVGESTDFVV